MQSGRRQRGTLMDINKNTKIITLLFLVSLLAEFGCRPKEYEYVRAYVYETKTYPLRDNYFKMNISYEFEYKGDTVLGLLFCVRSILYHEKRFHLFFAKLILLHIFVNTDPMINTGRYP